jgi:hypothetical protein
VRGRTRTTGTLTAMHPLLLKLWAQRGTTPTTTTRTARLTKKAATVRGAGPRPLICPLAQARPVLAYTHALVASSLTWICCTCVYACVYVSLTHTHTHTHTLPLSVAGVIGRRRPRKRAKRGPLPPEELAAHHARLARTGVVYLSRVPPYMSPATLRRLLSAHASIDRIYLAPEGTHACTYMYSRTCMYIYVSVRERICVGPCISVHASHHRIHLLPPPPPPQVA